MKLRVRLVDSKETIRIEAPEPCTLGLLKALIGDRVGAPSESLRLSLNRRDELLSTSPDDSLQSVGLASGDLIFYSSSSSWVDSRGEVGAACIPLNSLVDGRNSVLAVSGGSETSSLSLKPSAIAGEVSGEKLDPMTADPSVPTTLMEQESDGTQHKHDTMDIESDDAEGSFSPRTRSLSIPGFLKRVLNAEHVTYLSNLGILATAVHAVFLEAGFLVQGTGDTSRLPEGWASQVPTLSISYTVPELVVPAATTSSECDAVDSVKLKLCLLGRFVKVYGSVPGSPYNYYVCLNVSRFIPALMSTLGEISPKDEEEVFQLWKTVKDGLALRLLIDICERNGLASPPCFTRLPMDMKLMIMDLLPGADLAKLACVSSELRFLSSNDELWRRKFQEEFGNAEEKGVSWRRWKARFASSWERRKKLKEMHQQRQETYVPFLPFRRPQPLPVPFPAPRFPIIGGDYDLFPNIGGLGTASARHIPRPMGRRNFSPNCNLGGFGM